MVRIALTMRTDMMSPLTALDQEAWGRTRWRRHTSVVVGCHVNSARPVYSSMLETGGAALRTRGGRTPVRS